MKNLESIRNLARDLRKNPTLEEIVIWDLLRKRRMNGYKFLRQYPIVYKQEQTKYVFFIADFYGAQKKLVIELDGGYHRKQEYYDNQRDLVLEKMEINTIRIKNEELDDLEFVKRYIINALERV
ncbi:MAG TPA: endonuclease domain-containing protein [Balneolales bacterium]|nr:endonuclease domain-containing protein [Balneolales bacterium]